MLYVAMDPRPGVIPADDDQGWRRYWREDGRCRSHISEVARIWRSGGMRTFCNYGIVDRIASRGFSLWRR